MRLVTLWRLLAGYLFALLVCPPAYADEGEGAAASLLFVTGTSLLLYTDMRIDVHGGDRYRLPADELFTRKAYVDGKYDCDRFSYDTDWFGMKIESSFGRSLFSRSCVPGQYAPKARYGRIRIDTSDVLGDSLTFSTVGQKTERGDKDLDIRMDFFVHRTGSLDVSLHTGYRWSKDVENELFDTDVRSGIVSGLEVRFRWW